MAEYIKCGKTNFDIEKRKDKLFRYVVCNECGTIAGVLEDIDFEGLIRDLKGRHYYITENHQFFERRIDELERKIDKIIELLDK